MDQQAKTWGWRLLHAGRQLVHPYATYPDSEHPLNYLFDKNGRRSLEEYQIVFISRGSGTFESKSHPKITIQSGQAMVLFPNEWHRYCPDEKTGWSEHWVGFKGRETERIMSAFFSPQNPIYTVEHIPDLIKHYDQLLNWLQRSVVAQEQILASHLPLLLALIISGKSSEEATKDKGARLLSRAKAAMLENLDQHTDMEALATKLGVSYSSFRFTFKEQTGLSPRKFQNTIRLNRARDLLQHEQKSVSQTADLLGYSSTYYFSRAFKKEFGQPPSKC